MKRIVGLFLLLIWAAPLAAEIPAEMAIGVPRFDERAHLLDDNSRAVQILRAAVSAPVLMMRPESGGRSVPSKLILADSFQVDEDLLNWSYRLRPALVFSNGQPIRAADVCDSLSRCATEMPHELSYESCSVRDTPANGASREWIDLRFSSLVDLMQRQSLVNRFLSSCPIFEKRTRDIFGEDFAHDANFVGSGEYRLVSFSPGKEFRLERFQRDTIASAVPNQIVDVRAFQRSSDALAALRVGTILAFYDPDPETVAAAKADETLRIGECANVPIVYRRGVEFECPGQMKLSSIVWNLP